MCAWVVEPSNTWSNLAYVVIGCWILWLHRTELKSALTMVGVSSILVGLGSAAFHGTGTFVGEFLDVSAMYLISGLFIAFNIRRRFAWSDRKIVAFYVALVAVSSLQLALIRTSGIAMFALQVTIAGLMEINLHRGKWEQGVNFRDLYLLCVFFIAAFTAWTLDITGRACDPDNHVFTGHAFWHVANSFCLLFFYRYQRQFDRKTGTVTRRSPLPDPPRP